MTQPHPSSHPFAPSCAPVSPSGRDGAADGDGGDLRESLLGALAASDTVGVAVCDRELRYLLWNRFMEVHTGFPAAAVLGRCVLDLHPGLGAEGLEAVLRRVLAGEAVSLPFQRYTRPGAPGGWIRAQYHPHRGADGRVKGVVGLVHGVAEQAQAAAGSGDPRELEAAVERGEVTAYFQPLVSLATGAVSGAEALARWLHPERGCLPPAEFVAAAEESGVIAALGARILEDACRAAASWPAPLEVSVNLSARQLGHPGLVGEVCGALEGSGLAAERLRLEVTESTLIADADGAAATLGRLRELGARVWMDDFGTGYSSLAVLHRLPVDGVKVDRSFVAGMGKDGRAGQVVAAVLGLARGLGVERPEQLFVLRTLGCGAAQGFLFAPALEAEAFAGFVACGHRW
jgi:PAS domain S-box-containing protein